MVLVSMLNGENGDYSMKDSKQRYSDFSYPENAEIYSGFLDAITVDRYKELTQHIDRRYATHLSEKLFEYAFDLSMGYESEELQKDLDLLDSEIKAFSSLLTYMTLFINASKNREGFIADESGVYKWCTRGSIVKTEDWLKIKSFGK